MLILAMGKLHTTGITDPDERTRLANAKCRELGIKVLHRTGVVGRYDFVTMMDVPSVDAAAEFAQYFRSQDFGDPEIMVVTQHIPGEPPEPGQ